MTSIRPCERRPEPAYLPNRRRPSTLQFVQEFGSRLHQGCAFRKRLRDLECDNRRIEKHVAVYSCQAGCCWRGDNPVLPASVEWLFIWDDDAILR